jgi:hypothetical protein
LYLYPAKRSYIIDKDAGKGKKMSNIDKLKISNPELTITKEGSKADCNSGWVSLYMNKTERLAFLEKIVNKKISSSSK